MPAGLLQAGRPALERPGPSPAAPARAARAPPRGRRPTAVRVAAVAEVFRAAGPQEAILCQRFAAHSAAVAAALVLEDTEAASRLVTSSLDKTLALWVADVGGDGCDPLCCEASGFREAVRLSPPGAPVFSLAEDERALDGLEAQVFLGCASKAVAAWVPPRPELEPGVVLGGHSGWVRSLAAVRGRWLFSAACSTIRGWDLARAVPSEAPGAALALDKGDVVALAAGRERLYAATADGALHAWAVGPRGELAPAASRRRAHADRVGALALAGGALLSVGYDGAVRAWCAESLEPLAGADGAHGGARVHAAALGPDGVLYTGGDDALVRRWALGGLGGGRLAAAAPPLHAHNHAVRALAAGPRSLVVSADKGGEVAVWKVA